MPVPPNVRKDKGFSLIELMIAIFIIAITMLALLTSITVSQRTNLQNQVRDIAIRITNQTAEAILALPPNDSELSTGVNHTRIAGNTAQNMKGFPQKLVSLRGYQQDYTIAWTVEPTSAGLASKNLKVLIAVTYKFSGKDYSHNAAVFTGSHL